MAEEVVYPLKAEQRYFYDYQMTAPDTTMYNYYPMLEFMTLKDNLIQPFSLDSEALCRFRKMLEDDKLCVLYHGKLYNTFFIFIDALEKAIDIQNKEAVYDDTQQITRTA